MKPDLSIIIACFNDPDLSATVQSIRDTAGYEVEVVVVDDCSPRPIAAMLGVKLVRNARRIGCGPSRYIGAMHATGNFLLFTDAHMRFTSNWYENAMGKVLLPEREKTLHCGSCLTIKAGEQDSDSATGVYYGADFNFCGPDHKFPKLNQVMECVWAQPKSEDDYEIQAVMGACYFIQRDWFIKLDALRHLKVWAGDEQELSIKSWLAGGEIRLLKNVRIGHRFREGKASAMYVMPWHVIRNKLFIIHSCLPANKAMMLQMKMQRDAQFGLGLKALRDDWSTVETARAYNSALFVHNFDWLLARFGLTLPEK